MVARNNPFNIRYSPLNHWKGQIGYRKGFVVFRELKFGVRAAACLFMKSYPSFGIHGIASAIARYAPSSENNTESYIRFICDKLNMLPFDYPQTKDDFFRLLHFVWKYEQGVYPSEVQDLLIKSVIDELWIEFGKKD